MYQYFNNFFFFFSPVTNSFTEWNILHRNDREIQFGFLYNTLVLNVGSSSSSSKDRKILSISKKSRLSGKGF